MILLISINPLKQRELNLRGYKAPAIENLGVTKDGFDCIDLSDNEVKKLENFPRLRRLRMLLLNNNQISKIHDTLAESIENLEYLILTSNHISQLAEIDPLAAFKKLDTLSLMGNPVTKRKYYREYVVSKLPQLRVLDFQKIKPREREAVEAFFNSAAGKRAMQELISGVEPTASSTTAPPPPPPPPAPVRTPSFTLAPPAAPTAPPAMSSVPAPTAPPAPPAPTKKQVAKQEEKDAAPVKQQAPSTPPARDVEMTQVPFTPTKPIETYTVTQLRDALKGMGLSTKGLKAELVKRLKEAVGGA